MGVPEDQKLLSNQGHGKRNKEGQDTSSTAANRPEGEKANTYDPLVPFSHHLLGLETVDFEPE